MIGLASSICTPYVYVMCINLGNFKQWVDWVYLTLGRGLIIPGLPDLHMITGFGLYGSESKSSHFIGCKGIRTIYRPLRCLIARNFAWANVFVSYQPSFDLW